MPYTTDTYGRGAFKKLYGRSNIGPGADLGNEAYASGVTTSAPEVWVDPIPNPAAAVADIVVACTGANALQLVSIAASGGLAYQAVIPSALHQLVTGGYTNPITGTPYVDYDPGTLHNEQSDAYVGNIIPTKFDPTPGASTYRAILKNNGTEVPPFDLTDWYLDEKSGIVLSETALGLVNGTLECYVYVGRTRGVTGLSADGSEAQVGDIDLIAGANITLTPGVGSITIASDAGGGGEANTGANVGAGDGLVFRDKTGVTLNFRTLVDTPTINVATVGNEITFTAVPAFILAGGTFLQLSDTPSTYLTKDRLMLRVDEALEELVYTTFTDVQVDGAIDHAGITGQNPHATKLFKQITNASEGNLGSCQADVADDLLTINGAGGIKVNITDLSNNAVIVIDGTDVAGTSDQNIWLTIAGNTGSIAATSTASTLTIQGAGGGLISTALTGNGTSATLTISTTATGNQNLYSTVQGDGGTTSASPNTTTSTLRFQGAGGITCVATNNTMPTADVITITGSAGILPTGSDGEIPFYVADGPTVTTYSGFLFLDGTETGIVVPGLGTLTANELVGTGDPLFQADEPGMYSPFVTSKGIRFRHPIDQTWLGIQCAPISSYKIHFPELVGTSGQYLRIQSVPAGNEAMLQWATGTGGGATNLDDLDDVDIAGTPRKAALLQFDPYVAGIPLDWTDTSNLVFSNSTDNSGQAGAINTQGEVIWPGFGRIYRQTSILNTLFIRPDPIGGPGSGSVRIYNAVIPEDHGLLWDGNLISSAAGPKFSVGAPTTGSGTQYYTWPGDRPATAGAKYAPVVGGGQFGTGFTWCRVNCGLSHLSSGSGTGAGEIESLLIGPVASEFSTPDVGFTAQVVGFGDFAIVRDFDGQVLMQVNNNSNNYATLEIGSSLVTVPWDNEAPTYESAMLELITLSDDDVAGVWIKSKNGPVRLGLSHAYTGPLLEIVTPETGGAVQSIEIRLTDDLGDPITIRPKGEGTDTGFDFVPKDDGLLMYNGNEVLSAMNDGVNHVVQHLHEVAISTIYSDTTYASNKKVLNLVEGGSKFINIFGSETTPIISVGPGGSIGLTISASDDFTLRTSGAGNIFIDAVDDVKIKSWTWPAADGSSGQAMVTNGSGILGFTNPVPASHTHVEADITDLGSYLENVVEDTTPQLGGNLDTNGKEINNAGSGDIVIDSANDQVIIQDDSIVAKQIVFDPTTQKISVSGASGDDLTLAGSATGNVNLGADLDTNGKNIIFQDLKGIYASDGNELVIFNQAASSTAFIEISNGSSFAQIKCDSSSSTGILRFDSKGTSGLHQFFVNATQEATIASSGLDVVNTVRAESLIADGDSPGPSGTNTMTNVSEAVVVKTGAAALTFLSDSTTGFTHKVWKMEYINGVETWFPGFQA